MKCIPIKGSGVPQRPPLLPLSSVPTSTTDSSITSMRPEDMGPNVTSSLGKPEDRPPLIATLPLLPPHDDLPPRLHPDRPMDRNFGPRDRFRPNMERPDLDRPPHNDDPFAPSVYELRAMERNQMMRPPIPHQMGGTGTHISYKFKFSIYLIIYQFIGRSGLMPIPHNMNERFPFEPRPQRPYHPRHHNMRPDIRHHHNFDRHANHPNRGTGRDQYPNRGFGRRERPSRWKSDDNHSRHYNRNNNNSEYNSGFNNKFDRRRDDREEREQQSDDSFPMDNSFDNSVNESNNCNNNNNNENNVNINTTNESSFDDLNSVVTNSDFNENNNQMLITAEDNSEQNISQTFDDSVNCEAIPSENT